MSREFYEKNVDLAVVNEQLGGFDLVVARGITPILMDQVVDNSLQHHILDASPEDATRRFKSRDTFEEWWASHDGLATYVLLANDKRDLAGLIWHRPSALPKEQITPPNTQASNANHTFGVRLYEPYRGRKLAKPFMRTSLLDYMEQPEVADDFNGMWLTTRSNPKNAAVQELYRSFGYERYALSADKERLTMVLSAKRAIQIKRAHAGAGD
jgi:ribosomal protein S18 acetylase RimI-like enzyme